MDTGRMSLSMPKRLKGGCKNCTSGGAKTAPQGCKNCTHKRTYKKRTNIREQKGGENTPQSRVREIDKAREMVAGLRKYRDEVTNELEQVRVLRQTDLAKFWRERVISAYPDRGVLPLATATRAALWHKQKAYNIATGNSGETFAAFVTDVVRRWTGMLATEFHWMNQKPELPDAWFFITHFDRIFRAWETKRHQWATPETTVAQSCKQQTKKKIARKKFKPRIGPKKKRLTIKPEDYKETLDFGDYD